MGYSNEARLIQAEGVYKEKIRQLEATIELQQQQLDYYIMRILRQDAPAIESGEILEAEIVETKAGTWAMFHDPDGNEYGK